MPIARRPVTSRAILAAIFFASGAASLVFEVVWFHRCGLVFGNSLWSTSIVLSSFMGGLAIGNAAVARFGHRVSRMLRAYALLEITVAVSGIALTAALPGVSNLVTPITRRVLDSAALVNLVRLAGAFGCLLVPATAMGATLPVLTGALGRFDPRFGRTFGWLYGWNAAGAVIGVVAAEAVLIENFGVMGSAWIAGAIDVAVAFVALRASSLDEAMQDRTPPAAAAPSGDAWRLLSCGFLSGMLLMAFEVVWFRFLSLFVIALTLPLALMLAVVLAGIATGGIAASVWLRLERPAHAASAAVALAAGCVAAASYGTFRFVAGHTQVSDAAQILGYACWLTLPTAVLSGALLTLLGSALRRDIADDTRTAGWMTLANTVGSMLGPLLATFALLPRLGIERSIFLLVFGYFALGLLAFASSSRGPRTGWGVKLIAASTATTAVLLTFPFGLLANTYVPRATGVYTRDGATIAAMREGTRDTLFLIRGSLMGRPLYYRLATNNISMSATTLVDKRYMRYFVYLPMLLHERPIRRVLVACYGIGLTAGAATDVPSVESIDVVEISPDIVAMSDIVYAGAAHPLHDRRVRLHVEDARQFLGLSSERFDLITGEPPPPPLPGTASLFSFEYFQLLRDHLTDDGIVSYWLPVARQVGYDVGAVVRAFCDVFDDCSVWNGTPSNLILVGTRRPLDPLSEQHFAHVWSDPAVWPHLREIGFEQPEEIGATFMGDRVYLDQLAANARPVTDDYPRRLLPDPRRYSLADPRSRDPGVLAYYRAAIDPDRSSRAFEASPLIRRLWPKALLERTIPFFEHQRIVNRVLQDGPKPLQHIEELDFLLDRTTLRRLPLWALGSNDVEQEIAQAGDDGSAQFSYLIGLRTLAARSYPLAASYFAEAMRRGMTAPTVQPLMVYALCLSGSLDAAREAARGVRPSDASEIHFWRWIGNKFAVGPYLAPAPAGGASN